MGKVINRGWQLTADDAPVPIGIIMGNNLRRPVPPTVVVLAPGLALVDGKVSCTIPEK